MWKRSADGSWGSTPPTTRRRDLVVLVIVLGIGHAVLTDGALDGAGTVALVTLRDRIARDVVASLRSAAGRNPYYRDLSDLVGELSIRSEEVRQLWARHDVRFHISGTKRFHHAQVGDLELNYERLRVVFDTDLIIFAYTADPGTRSAGALNLLGSLAATTDAERASATPHREERCRADTFCASSISACRRADRGWSRSAWRRGSSSVDAGAQVRGHRSSGW